MPYQLIPTTLTLCNFACGLSAIYAVFAQKYTVSILCIVLGILFDILDGWTARKLNVVSTFGKELDSLSDILTFGVAPAVLGYQFSLEQLGSIGLIIAFYFSICAVLRLARFNSTQSELSSFIGLPVPGAAIGLLISIFVFSPWLLAISTLLLANLMMSRIRFPHFKKIKVYEKEERSVN